MAYRFLSICVLYKTDSVRSMFSRILSAPFLILGIGFLYLTWEVGSDYSWYIIPCVIILAVIYIMSPQIDWWWAKRNPPDVDEKLRAMVHSKSAFYQRLSAEDKTYFRRRMALFLMSKEFMPQAFDTVPEDIKAMIAAAAIQVTFGKADFVMEPFDKVVVYPDAFPSPKYPRDRHSVEVFAEDGVSLLSAKHVAHSFLEPETYYPVAIHNFVQVFLSKYPSLDYPDEPANAWDKIEAISSFDEERIKKFIGLPIIDAYTVLLSCFFAYPRAFDAELPELYEQLKQLFTLDPNRPVSSAPLVS